MRRTVSLLFLASLFMAGPARAATWSAPTGIGEAGSQTSIQTVALPDGTAVIGLGGGNTRYSLRMPGGDFGPLTSLGDRFDGGVERGVGLSMNASGRGLLVWDGDVHNISVAVREPGSSAFTKLPDFVAYPNVQGLGPIGGVAGAVGADGRLYIAFGDGYGARLFSAAPGQTSFTEIERVPATPVYTTTDGQRYGSPPGTLAVTTENGGSTVDLLTPADGGLTLARWSVDGGAEPLRVVEQEVNDYRGLPAPTDQTSQGVKRIWVAEGDRPAFFWNQVTTRYPANSKTVGESTWTDTLWRSDAPMDGSAAPVLQETKPEYFYGHEPAPIVATDVHGVGVVAWFPQSANTSPPTPVEPLEIVQRTTPGGTFGPVVRLSALDPKGTGIGLVGIAPTGGGAATLLYEYDDQLLTVDLSPDGKLGTPTAFPVQERVGGYLSAAGFGGSGHGDLFAFWGQTPPQPAEGFRPPTQFVVSHNDVGPIAQTPSATSPLGAPGSPGGAPVRPPAAALALPLISKLALTNKRFVATTGKPSGTHGTTISLTLAQRATLTLSVTTAVRGYRATSRSSSACRAAKPRGRRTARCTLTRSFGAIRADATAGRNAIPFTGTLRGKRLPAGTYALRITAKNDAGAVAPPALIHFVIRRG